MGLTPKQKAALDRAERLHQRGHQMTNTELDGITDAALDVAWNAIDAAGAEITTLRAQLAEARAERDKWYEGWGVMHVSAMREAQRADRAEQLVANLEAALAAQIERDAAIAQRAWRQEYDPTPEIRAQPHDRSALDAMLAEARVKALREFGRAGQEAAELCVDLSRIGLFPSVGFDYDDNEYVLGPFSLADKTYVTGCASVLLDDDGNGYRWAAYMEIGGAVIRGCWPIDTIPDELRAAILALAQEGGKG